LKLELMIMSGVYDGLRLNYDSNNGDGEFDSASGKWTISIGRHDDSDVCLRSDSFVSRQHATLYWENQLWWLEDLESTNGTFLENGETDARVTTARPVQVGALFRIGHTWMRIQAMDDSNP
jgi:pSer/pThr/pTyr-binding forkhead associated (FHA) protein